jgi:hypothetical protein
MPLLRQSPLRIDGPSPSDLLVLLYSAFLKFLDALLQLLPNLRIFSRDVDDPLELQLSLNPQLGYVNI